MKLENVHTGNIYSIISAGKMSNGQYVFHLSNGAYIPQSSINKHWRVVQK